MVEVALCLILFTACALHVRLRLKNAAEAAKSAPDTTDPVSSSNAKPAV
jgi:hypothetical protein